jgi:hypothetical protein
MPRNIKNTINYLKGDDALGASNIFFAKHPSRRQGVLVTIIQQMDHPTQHKSNSRDVKPSKAAHSGLDHSTSSGSLCDSISMVGQR